MNENGTIELSALDRADVRDALSQLAEQFEETAEDCQPHVVVLKKHLLSKARRFRELAALFSMPGGVWWTR